MNFPSFVMLLGTVAFPLLPDPKLTPGDVLEDVTVEQLAVHGYTATVRNVPESLKRKVLEEYGLRWEDRHEVEIDHLISLELGGSNDIKNLWPQSYHTPVWNAHIKDKLENYLHWMIVHKRITLKQAQKVIARDWIQAFKLYMPEDDQIEGPSVMEKPETDRNQTEK